jgi:hypothetical protein
MKRLAPKWAFHQPELSHDEWFNQGPGARPCCSPSFKKQPGRREAGPAVQARFVVMIKCEWI